MAVWLRIVLLTLALLWCTGSAAGAHSELVGSTPEPGAKLAVAPDRITLIFNEDVDPRYAAMTLSIDDTPQGELEPVRVPAVPGGLVAGIAESDLIDGRWRVGYRVTSVDGHPIEGTIDFSVGESAGDAAESSAGHRGEGISSALLAGGIGAVAVVVLSGVLFWKRRRSAGDESVR